MSTLHDPTWRGFASDNYAGLHPEVLTALAEANGGHDIAYGEDAYTARLQEVIAGHVGAGAVTWPVFNGTGANVVALQALLPRWGAVVCAETAHIHTDEGGAPERMGSIKLLTVPTPDGKLTPELIDRQAWGFGDEHRAQPLVVSITQTTELGTCYTPDEVRAISDHAHSLGMRVHLDGARISNAAATLGTDLSAFTGEAGVDVLSLGRHEERCARGRGRGRGRPRAGRRPGARPRPPAQAVDAAGLQDALRVGAAARALRERPVAALCRARQRDGGAPRRCGRRRRGRPDHPGRAGQRGLRGAATARSPTRCARASASTTGTRPPARCAGCARGTRRRPTSTPSPPSCAASSPAPDRALSGRAVGPFRVVSAPRRRHDDRVIDYTDVRHAYDTVASDYAERLPDTRAETALDLAMVDAFVAAVLQRRCRPATAPVLDAGCGAGRMSAHLAARGVQVRGVDLSPGMVEMARRDHPTLDFTVGSLDELPCQDGEFAGVLLWYSIIHTPPAGLDRVLAEAVRVLRPGGHLLVGFQSGTGTRDVGPVIPAAGARGAPRAAALHRRRGRQQAGRGRRRTRWRGSCAEPPPTSATTRRSCSPAAPDVVDHLTTDGVRRRRPPPAARRDAAGPAAAQAGALVKRR